MSTDSDSFALYWPAAERLGWRKFFHPGQREWQAYAPANSEEALFGARYILVQHEGQPCLVPDWFVRYMKRKLAEQQRG